MNASELSSLRGLRRSAYRLSCTRAAPVLLIRGRLCPTSQCRTVQRQTYRVRGRLCPTSQCRTVQRHTYRVARVLQIDTNGGLPAGRPVDEGMQGTAARAAWGRVATAVLVSIDMWCS